MAWRPFSRNNQISISVNPSTPSSFAARPIHLSGVSVVVSGQERERGARDAHVRRAWRRLSRLRRRPASSPSSSASPRSLAARVGGRGNEAVSDVRRRLH